MRPHSPRTRRRSAASARDRGLVVNATDAAKNFGALVDHVRESRAAYIVERAGVPVAQIAPVVAARATVADLVEILRAPGGLDETYLRDVERGVRFLNAPGVPADPWGS